MRAAGNVVFALIEIGMVLVGVCAVLFGLLIFASISSDSDTSGAKPFGLVFCMGGSCWRRLAACYCAANFLREERGRQQPE